MMKTKSGFTLVEILIVVVILGILAAIVIPQFTSASTEAKESALRSNLQAVRAQIQLYKIHHGDDLPTVGNATFEECMIGLTDKNGDVAAIPGPNIYGPYMRKIPDNPFTDALDKNDVEVDGAVVGNDSHGWNFVMAVGATQGLFQPDDNEVNPLDAADPHTGY